MTITSAVSLAPFILTYIDDFDGTKRRGDEMIANDESKRDVHSSRFRILTSCIYYHTTAMSYFAFPFG
jgi:hypothetical protein